MDQQTAVTDDELWGAPAGPPAAPPEEGSGGGRSRARTWIAALAGTVVVGVAAVVGANIASSSTQNLGAAGAGGGVGPGGFNGRGGPAGLGGGNAGTIASIDGATIKMTNQAGTTVSVTTSAATTVTVTSAGALTDVRVGDNVRVTGTTSGTMVTANAITDSGTNPLADVPDGGFPGGRVPGGGRPDGGGPPPNGAAPPANFPANGAGPRGGGGPATTGVVKTVNSGTFTVATADGATLTVSTSASTVVTVVKPGTLAALKVGDTIQVTGTRTDNAIAATGIRAGAE